MPSLNDFVMQKSRPLPVIVAIDKSGSMAVATMNKIVCMDCFTPVTRPNASQLSYLQCDCGFVLDSTNNHVLYSNKDTQYSHLGKDDWGMDYIEFDLK